MEGGLYGKRYDFRWFFGGISCCSGIMPTDLDQYTFLVHFRYQLNRHVLMYENNTFHMDKKWFEEISERSYAKVICESMESAYDFVTSSAVKEKSIRLDYFIAGLIENQNGFLEASLLEREQIENYIGMYKYIRKVSGAETLSDAYNFVSDGCLDERIVNLWLEEELLEGLEMLDSGHLKKSIEAGYLQNKD